jgi:hypothetical protein
MESNAVGSDAPDGAAALLEALLRARIDSAGAAWLDKALAAVAGPAAVETVLGFYAGAGRRVGKQALALDAAEQTRARAVDEALGLSRWGRDEAARALLLLRLPRSPADEFGERVLACYEKGDSREQESWLRGLAVLPQPGRFLATAVDSCRTNIIPMFEAICCENPYPARHFPELNFNQMVLKALFNNIALERIVGLAGRQNAELSRMANDYATEREAAGRPVPADIWAVIVPHAPPGSMARILRYLAHDDPAHRYWAAVGLGTSVDAQARARLQERREQETDARVRGAIESSLAARG